MSFKAVRALAAIVLLLLPAAAFAQQITIVALGDSLTAGYGLPSGQGFPAQLERALRARGHDVRVIDAGVSGDTTRGGLRRLDYSVPASADAVIVELGANDMLRGYDIGQPSTNLDRILTRLRARGLPVLLAGMRATRNLGPEYGRAFAGIYPRLARKHGAILYPYFLEGVAGDRALNLRDGIHPTAQGIAIIVRNILPSAEKLVAAAKRRAAG